MRKNILPVPPKCVAFPLCAVRVVEDDLLQMAPSLIETMQLGLQQKNVRQALGLSGAALKDRSYHNYLTALST